MFSYELVEYKPLPPARPWPRRRGLHSSTFRLNVSAFCGIGVLLGVVQGAFRGCSEGVQGVFKGCSGDVQGVSRGCSGSVQGCSGGVQGVSWGIKRCLECISVLETAQVELKSGRM